MQVIYSIEPFPIQVQKTIFLAGPTSRVENVKSWRKEALVLLEELGYDGHVFIPEPRNGIFDHDYSDQVEWEDEFLQAADIILFWVPRDMEGEHSEGNGTPIPGLTTNDEWGFWKNSGKVVWGSPDWADSTKYQKFYADKFNVPAASNLKETIELALKKLGEGVLRNGYWNSKIPSFIWSNTSFQKWYDSQIRAGNTVKNVDVKNVLWVNDEPFLYTLQPVVYITEEERDKSSENVVFRPDISTVCLYKSIPKWLPDYNVMNTKIVLVKEFRTPVRNDESYVYELPGGSSLKETSPLHMAADEVSEELGITIKHERLKFHGSRQMGATLVTYHSHLYSAELTDEELSHLEDDTEVHGDGGDEEGTYIRVMTLGEIFNENVVDWAMLGMIFKSLNTRKN